MVCHGHPDPAWCCSRERGANFCAGRRCPRLRVQGEKLPDYIRQATAYLQNAVTGLLRLEAPVITSVQDLPQVVAALVWFARRIS